jgi:hypothetical protein
MFLEEYKQNCSLVPNCRPHADTLVTYIHLYDIKFKRKINNELCPITTFVASDVFEERRRRV